jgi:chlorite dismutase
METSRQGSLYPHTMSGPIVRVCFVASAEGDWSVDQIRAVKGAPLPEAPRLTRLEAPEFAAPSSASWVLRGVRSNERYVARAEKQQLATIQEGLGRPASRRAVLIPIRKSPAWWELAQDERRAIFEERSAHIAVGSRYLPAIARRLYHGRDLGEPFDFLTWFEFSDADSGAFDDLVGRLRETEEWRYVVREVEVRLALHRA